MRGRKWEENEIEYLKEYLGDKSILQIAKHLNRSIQSVIQKANKLRLSTAYSGDKISFYTLITELGFGGSYTHLYEKWKSMGLKISDIYLKNTWVRKVSLDDFWKWSEKHQDKVDFRNLEHNAFGYEPQWATEKIRRDRRRVIEYKYKKTWTKEEDAMLLQYIKKNLTSREISERLNRSQTSIENRVTRLNVPNRPNIYKKRYWTNEEIEKMITMIEQGCGYDEVSCELNRGAGSCKAKHFRILKQS